MNTSKPELIFPIVGGYFRPPSISICKNLPQNTPLVLYPEPWNTKDPNAIGVWIHQTKIPFEKLKPDLNIEYNSKNEFQLGFIPAVDAVNLKFDRSLAILGIFKVLSNGKPAVKLTKFQREEPKS